ncbi:NADH-quinone oxidoreductase subunit N [Adhaeribacter rhizoryzae]|uniref:NADH-quinone oxidoreductase subunit N n=1 Tax=Adhaeribacter rhizoryzae TaxID=2607907 RepID=A0A5M6DIK0_9BACT|nr:NADH-quinone oxidoreductase subunit N [Adhaeribacter rhizoryzae]KAA5547417.1 NADH-quinone oxidoreductase subunit N [Adhaeribacter rhizoryzae]
MNITAQSLITSLTEILGSFAFLGPELMLALFFLLIVALDLFKSKLIKAALPWVALSGILISLISQIYFLNNNQAKQAKLFFSGLLITDGLALYAGLLFSVAGILTIVLSVLSKQLQLKFSGRGEYYAYILVLLAGLNLMAKSVNLLMLFVALELVSIGSYLLTTAIKRQQDAMESGLKYILYGTLASGVMLYGMSFLYGFGGSLSFLDTAFWANLSRLDSPFFLVIFLLTFAGFLFKIAAAPFHFWAPDVYEGAPTPIVAFFATAPKIAGFVVIIRFLLQIKNNLATTLQDDVMLLVGGISLLSLVIGNFTALWQSRARRLLAYSSVAHAGFLLAALAALATNSIEAVLFYLSVLLFMNFGIFLLVQVFEERLQIFDIKGLAGQGKTYPLLGVLAIIILISLTGLPPTAGFTSKLLLFTNIWQNYSATGNQLLLTLLLVGLLLTGVAFFYYIRIPYFLFFKRNLNPEKKVVLGREDIVLAFISFPLLLFFFQPAWLTELIRQVVLYSK